MQYAARQTANDLEVCCRDRALRRADDKGCGSCDTPQNRRIILRNDSQRSFAKCLADGGWLQSSGASFVDDDLHDVRRKIGGEQIAHHAHGLIDRQCFGRRDKQQDSTLLDTQHLRGLKLVAEIENDKSIDVAQTIELLTQSFRIHIQVFIAIAYGRDEMQTGRVRCDDRTQGLLRD